MENTWGWVTWTARFLASVSAIEACLKMRAPDSGVLNLTPQFLASAHSSPLSSLTYVSCVARRLAELTSHRKYRNVLGSVSPSRQAVRQASSRYALHISTFPPSLPYRQLTTSQQQHPLRAQLQAPPQPPHTSMPSCIFPRTLPLSDARNTSRENPARPVSSPQMPPTHDASERLLTRTVAVSKSGFCLWYIFEDVVHNIPDHTEAIWSRAGCYTWQETYAQAGRYGQFFLQNGVKPAELVSFYLTNQPEFIFAHLGSWSVGSAPAMINHHLAGDALVHCLKVAGGKLVLVDEDEGV